MFWCFEHESLLGLKDRYKDVFSCDSCHKAFANDSWMTCRACESYFKTFDLCSGCFGLYSKDHQHGTEDFSITGIFVGLKFLFSDNERRKVDMHTENTTAFQKAVAVYAGRTQKRSLRKAACALCFVEFSEFVDKVRVNGVDLCFECEGESSKRNSEALVDLAYKRYSTRATVEKALRSRPIDIVPSQGPGADQLYSTLLNETSFFDLKGRAAKWSRHSASDYHGTWVPQIARHAILRYTEPGGVVLSNFLGRGTDLIECYILKRRAIGVDVNPSSIALASRNLNFELPRNQKDSKQQIEKPSIVMGDARALRLGPFQDTLFDLILSHPPYKVL